MTSKQGDYAKKYAKSGKPSYVPGILAALIVVLALISGAAIYVKQQSEYDRQLAKQAQLLEEYNLLKNDNIAIEGEINSIGSDDYVKRIAQDVLGMVWPNQVVFKDGDEQAGNQE